MPSLIPPEQLDTHIDVMHAIHGAMTNDGYRTACGLRFAIGTRPMRATTQTENVTCEECKKTLLGLGGI